MSDVQPKPKPVVLPRLRDTPQHNPYANSATNRKYDTERQATRLGHHLGKWSAPTGATFEQRSECVYCSAEVYVDWRGPGQGWSRAAGLEIQVKCTDDMPSDDVVAEAVAAYTIMQAIVNAVRGCIREELNRSGDKPSLSMNQKYLAVLRKRLALYERKRDLAEKNYEKRTEDYQNGKHKQGRVTIKV